MEAINTIFQPLEEGKHIIIQRGRDLRDFTLDTQGRILPLTEGIRAEALKRGMVLIEYSKSSGVTYDASTLTKAESQDVDNVLSSLGITKPSQSCNNSDDQEFVKVMRGLLNLVQLEKYPTFRDGRNLAFMVIIHFAEHNAPAMAQPGFLSNEQMISIELASTLSKSLGLRKSNSYVIFSETREGTLDDILTKHIEVLRLPQPNQMEKELFLAALNNRYPNAKLEAGLTKEVVVNISSNSPNRSLEQVYLTSTKSGNPVTSSTISKKKQEDIIRLSEGTLEAVDSERIKNQKLVGRNVQRPIEILKITTDALSKGKTSALRNIILAGAPSTGKTDLATIAAFQSKIQAFNLNSPKSSLVGESERKTKLMLSILREQRGIGIIDELEMVLPMNRGGSQNNDSGVTNNLMGQLQQFLSDSSLSGKVSLISTSNKPGSVSAAMLSRWVVVPVLMPLIDDYPLIVRSLSEGISKTDLVIDASDLKIISDRFYYSGASPREIRESIIASMAFLNRDNITVENLVFASKNVVPSANTASYIHSDLSAIYHTRFNAFLPWWNIEQNMPDTSYPFPSYIADILDKDLMIDQKKLREKLNELEPYSNV